MTKKKKPARLTTSKRRLEVERQIRMHGWSGPWVSRLAAKLGVSVRTIRRDRAEVVETLADADLGDREQRRMLFLMGLERDRVSAKKRGAWGAVLRARALEARVNGFDRLPPPPPRPPEIEGEDPLRRRLRMTRYRIELAQTAGSMTAAAKLADREQALLDEIEAKEARLAERRRLSEDEEALLARFEAAVDKVPEAVAAKLLDTIRAKLGGAE